MTPPPSSVNPEVAPAIDRIVMRALDARSRGALPDRGRDGERDRTALRDMRGRPTGPSDCWSRCFPMARAQRRGPALPFTPRFFGDSGSGRQRACPPPRTSVGEQAAAVAEAWAVAPRVASGTGRLGAQSAPARRWWTSQLARPGAIAGAVIAFVRRRITAQAAPVTVAPAGAQPVPAPAPPPIAAPAPAARAARCRRRPGIARFDPAGRRGRVRGFGRGGRPHPGDHRRCHAGTSRSPSALRSPASRRPATRSSPILDKAVRVELTAEPTADPKRAIASQQRTAACRRSGQAATGHEARPADSRACRRSAAQLRVVGRLVPLGRSLDRRPRHWPAHAGRALPGLVRRAQAGAQAARPQARSLRAVMVAPGHELKQHYELGNYTD